MDGAIGRKFTFLAPPKIIEARRLGRGAGSAKYLDGLITILLKLNSPIIWITPAGLKISWLASNIKFKKERTTSSLIP